jgi:hypothetical protein
MSKKAFISQPMSGVCDEEIQQTKDRIVKILEEQGYEVVHNKTYNDYSFTDENLEYSGYCHPQICRIGYDLIEMAKCELLYCAKGWELKKGCCIEEYVARLYGLDIIYEK